MELETWKKRYQEIFQELLQVRKQLERENLARVQAEQKNIQLEKILEETKLELERKDPERVTSPFPPKSNNNFYATGDAN